MTGGERAGVVVVAAGSAARMGGTDKQFADLRGRPVVAHCLDTFQASPMIGPIALVVTESNLQRAHELVERRDLSAVVAIAAGEGRRQDSVRAGLDALLAAASDSKVVVVHDGARPFVDDALIERGLAAVRKTGAAVAGTPARDTMKEVDAGGVVVSTPDRSRLWAVQTPQVFDAALLARAHREVGEDVTDDGAMVELLGGKVTVFEGSPANIKITTPEDLLFAGMLAESRAGVSTGGASWGRASGGDDLRWGTGFDGHRLAAGVTLVLGGVEVPFELGLEGHSDGDVLLHAITSAVLGAAGLGDMGSHFPSTDPSLAGIDSTVLLQRAVAMAAERGWAVVFVDATIVAQRPKLSPYLEAMAESIAQTLDLDAGLVNVKATSTDGVGAIGEGAGIAAQAIVTLKGGQPAGA